MCVCVCVTHGGCVGTAAQGGAALHLCDAGMPIRLAVTMPEQLLLLVFVLLGTAHTSWHSLSASPGHALCLCGFAAYLRCHMQALHYLC